MPTRDRSRTCDPEDAPVIDFGTSDACSVRSLKNRIAEAALADDAAGFRRALVEVQEHWGNLLNIPPPMSSGGGHSKRHRAAQTWWARRGIRRFCANDGAPGPPMDPGPSRQNTGWRA